MRCGHRYLLLVTLVAASLAPAVSAEELDSTASMTARLNDLERQVARVNELDAELAAVRQQLQGSQAAPACDGCAPCGAPCCCEPSCCDPCCCLPCCQMGWYGGAELVMAQPSPHLDGLEYDFEPTPRVWLGYNGCGLGVRGHWWQFEGDGNPFVGVDVNIISPGVTFVAETSAEERLELELADLELTKMYSGCGSTFVVAGGARYVRHERQRTGQFSVTQGGLPVSAFLTDETERFQGVGPTLAAEVVTPVTCQWSLYAGFRATIAFGNQELSATTLDLLQGVENIDVASVNDRIQVIELELALQYTTGRWFARGGWQAQHWDEPSIFSLGVQGLAVAVGTNF